MNESQRTSSILKAIKQKKPNWYLIKQVQSGLSTIGVPDILGSINGRFVGIEVKMFGNVLSDPQIRQLRKIEKTGGCACLLIINENRSPTGYCRIIVKDLISDVELRSVTKDKRIPFVTLKGTLDGIERQCT